MRRASKECGIGQRVRRGRGEARRWLGEGCLRRAFGVLVLNACALLVGWRCAWAQPALQVVPTAEGVAVAVPPGLHPAAGLAPWPDLPVQVEGLATYTDGSDRPLNVQIRKGPAHGWESLPAADSALAAEWTERFVAELGVPEAYDFKPGRYEPERGALRLEYKVAGPSSARLMERLPETHPLWAATIEAGEEPKIAKCVLGALLGGHPSATEAELLARTPAAAEGCGLPPALVGKYLDQLGPSEFVPSVTTLTYIAFFTRLGTVGTLILAPLDRQESVDAAAELIWRGSEVAEDARLPVAPRFDAYRCAQLGGIALGAVAGVLLLGAALAWLVVRLGVRAPLAVGTTLGLLCALALTSLLRGALNAEGGILLGSYVLGSALAFRPLVHWLSPKRGSLAGRGRSLRRERGLSTVEYVVVLVLIVSVSIGAWSLFGASVKRALSGSSDSIGALGELTLDASPHGADGWDPAPPGNAASGNAAGALTRVVGESTSARPRTEPRGSAVQDAAASALQALQPGRALAPPKPPALPPGAGRVLASSAKEPSLLLRGADIATDFVPYLSNVKDATIAITGVNPITKERVGTLGRVVAGVFAIPAAGNLAKYLSKGTKYVLEGGKAAYEAGKAAKLGTRIASVLGKEAEQEIAKEGAERVAKEAAKGTEIAAAGIVTKKEAEEEAKAAAKATEKAAAKAGEGAVAASAVTIKPSKWDYFFGRVASNAHNEARSVQNLRDLKALGFDEANGGREALTKLFQEGQHLPEAARHVTDYGVTITRTARVGEAGAIDIKYFYPKGDLSVVPEISSIVPKVFK